MQGSIIACREHRCVHNATTRQWQEVSQEVFDELMAMAQEIGDVVVYEGCCPTCSEAASQSFSLLYHHRYADAMTRELRSDVLPAYNAEDD
ncbi:MAG: hypothetical protein WAP52_00860 [Candidatus Sungiibacteriota bacterium]